MAGGGGTSSAPRSSASVERLVALELELVAGDLLLLAVHEPDVVAEEEVQVLGAGAGEFFIDGLELEEEVVAESAGEGEVGLLGVAELVHQGAENAEDGRLFAALLFREEFGERLEAAHQRAALRVEGFPVRMPGQNGEEHLVEEHAAQVEGTELDQAVMGDDFQWRAGGGDIPARITAGVFIAGGEIEAAVGIQLAQEVFQAFAETRPRRRAADGDAVGGRVAKDPHNCALWRG